jgi:hypothetical protein
MKRRKIMKPTAGRFKANQYAGATVVIVEASRKNLRRAGTALATMFLLSLSAWAGNHQICYQLPPVPGIISGLLVAGFECRTDGTALPGCQITSVRDGSSQDLEFIQSRTATSSKTGVNVSNSGKLVATFSFTDGTTRKCTVDVIDGATLTPSRGTQLRELIGFNTDVSGLVMTGIWQATSDAAEQAFQNVVVPPDFVAVGGGSEGTETPQGTLVTSSIHSTAGSQFWLGGAHSNAALGVSPQISPVTVRAIGLKIEGLSISTLRQTVNFPSQSSPCCVSNPIVMFNLTNLRNYPATEATTAGLAQQTAISGGVQAEQGTGINAQYVTASQPGVSGQCYTNGTCEQLVRGWLAASKDHVFTTPSWISGQMTTAKVLTINGSTFHVETWVSQSTSAVLAHPSATATLPGDFALTGIGAFVDWQNSPSAAGNMVWNLKPIPNTNGIIVASKDQWFSSPAAITAYAIGMKLVPGPVPPLFVKTR